MHTYILIGMPLRDEPRTLCVITAKNIEEAARKLDGTLAPPRGQQETLLADRNRNLIPGRDTADRIIDAELEDRDATASDPPEATLRRIYEPLFDCMGGLVLKRIAVIA